MTSKHDQQPTSPARIAANRRNAQRSTGPRTPEGKERSALNAMRHGILADKYVIAKDEDTRQQFDALHLRLTQHFLPTNIMETILVERIAISYWRMRRLALAEAADIARLQARVGPQMPVYMPYDDTMQLYARYETMLQRQLYQAVDRLEHMRRQQPPGLPSDRLLPDMLEGSSAIAAGAQAQAAPGAEPAPEGDACASEDAAEAPDSPNYETNPLASATKTAGTLPGGIPMPGGISPPK